MKLSDVDDFLKRGLFTQVSPNSEASWQLLFQIGVTLWQKKDAACPGPRTLPLLDTTVSANENNGDKINNSVSNMIIWNNWLFVKP